MLTDQASKHALRSDVFINAPSTRMTASQGRRKGKGILPLPAPFHVQGSFDNYLKVLGKGRERRGGECPTSNGGMQNGSSVGTCPRCIHVFARLALMCMLSRCLGTKISASEIRRNFTKNALLVGWRVKKRPERCRRQEDRLQPEFFYGSITPFFVCGVQKFFFCQAAVQATRTVKPG